MALAEYCARSCGIGEVTLARKFGTGPWRCYGVSTLSEDTLSFEDGKRYCTRNKKDQIPGAIEACLES